MEAKVRFNGKATFKQPACLPILSRLPPETNAPDNNMTKAIGREGACVAEINSTYPLSRTNQQGVTRKNSNKDVTSTRLFRLENTEPFFGTSDNTQFTVSGLANLIKAGNSDGEILTFANSPAIANQPH